MLRLQTLSASHSSPKFGLGSLQAALGTEDTDSDYQYNSASILTLGLQRRAVALTATCYLQPH